MYTDPTKFFYLQSVSRLSVIVDVTAFTTSNFIFFLSQNYRPIYTNVLKEHIFHCIFKIYHVQYGQTSSVIPAADSSTAKGIFRVLLQTQSFLLETSNIHYIN